MKDMTKHGRQVFSRSAVALAVLSGMSCAHAVSFDLSNPDYRLRWDNTVRYNLGMRMDGQDSRIMNTPTYDESDSKFGKHDIVTNRVDLFSEVDFSYLNEWGARLSLAGWYDNAYRDTGVKSQVGGQTSYENGQYSDQVKRYVRGTVGGNSRCFCVEELSVG